MITAIDESLRKTFLGIADVLIPAHNEMPSASAAGVGGPVLDRILTLREDLVEPFFRGLKAAMGEPADVAARAMNQNDPKALAVIGLIASAAYYMDPKVRDIIGYPGQSRRDFDADAVPDYMNDGTLNNVIARGPIYRPA